MKYCQHCGAQILDEAEICPNCQKPVKVIIKRSEGLVTAIKVFMILACISPLFNIMTSNVDLEGISEELIGIITTASWIGCILPLAWVIPMTVVVFRKFKNNEPIGIGFKICTLIFVSLIAGILLLCLKDERIYSTGEQLSDFDDRHI